MQFILHPSNAGLYLIVLHCAARRTYSSLGVHSQVSRICTMAVPASPLPTSPLRIAIVGNSSASWSASIPASKFDRLELRGISNFVQVMGSRKDPVFVRVKLFCGRMPNSVWRASVVCLMRTVPKAERILHHIPCHQDVALRHFQCRRPCVSSGHLVHR